MIKHLRWAEYGWFEQFLQGRLDDNRRTHERSWEFELQPDESVPALITEYQAQCEESRRIAAQYPLDHELWHDRLKTTVSLRWIYVHMIQEIARHTGQLDILREQLDRLWTYQTRGGVARFLWGWLKALRWQRLPEPPGVPKDRYFLYRVV